MADGTIPKAGGSAATWFQPGNPGRPRGARNKRGRIIDEMIDGGLEEMTAKIVSQARHGDQKAIFYCLKRAAPVSKEVPVELELPPLDRVEDVAEASKRLIAALAEGEIAPSEASRIMALLKEHLAILESRAPEQNGEIEQKTASGQEAAAAEPAPEAAPAAVVAPSSPPAIRRLPRHMFID